MTHVITVSDIIWKWAQRKSGKANPASWLRDNCLYGSMIADIGEASYTAIVEATAEDRWTQIGMATNTIDTEFTEARTTFIDQIGGDDKAIAFFEDLSTRGIRDNRAWLMSWWHKQKPQAI